MAFTVEKFARDFEQALTYGSGSPEAAAIVWLAGVRCPDPDAVVHLSGPLCGPRGALEWLRTNGLLERDWRFIAVGRGDSDAAALFLDEPHADAFGAGGLASVPSDAPALQLGLEPGPPWRVTSIALRTAGDLCE